MSENTNTPRPTILGRILRNQESITVAEIREQVFRAISWIIIVAGILLLIISTPGDIAEGNYFNLVLDFIGFGTLLLVTVFQKRVPYVNRALILNIVVFTQSINDFLSSGILGDSRIWAMFGVVFLTILLGFRSGIVALIITVVFFIIGSLSVTNGVLELSDPEIQAISTNPDLILDALPIFVMSMSFLTFTIGSVIRGMERNQEALEVAYDETQTLTEQLTSEEELLRKQTAALEKRTRYIEAAAEVGKAATSIYNIDEMLEMVVHMISERFGFYQAGIFLIDERGEYANMVAASSDGGKRMLAREHRLRVGEEGMVGEATSSGLARIALDVGDEAVHFSNPELPLTRSEMALPLFYGGRIFGALDVQSTMEHAFTEEDISSLTVLADQVSMAINNARLFEELQTSHTAERQAFGEVSRQAWHALIRRTGSWGYRFSNNRTTSTEKSWPAEMVQALESKDMVNTYNANGALSIPILVSEIPVGAIRVEKPTDGIDWTDDEKELMQTLTDRLSQALESARVFQASQTQAMQEQLTTEISGQLRQTLDIDTVLKTAARELGDAFNAKEVVIRMAPDESRN